MKELLEAGVHFGHQTKRWNPKMKEYIFGERNGIYIIDLQKTLKMFKEASKFVTDLTSSGKVILFVGTKRQAQDAIAEEANRCGMFYINNRWLGGLLTNWVTVQKSVKRLQELDEMSTDGRYELLTKKEVIKLERERKHLNANLCGIKNMKRLPDALFIVDSNNEAIAVAKPASSASRWSPSSTPTAIPPWSTTSSPATTTLSAPSASSPPRSPIPRPRVCRWFTTRPSRPRPWMPWSPSRTSAWSAKSPSRPPRLQPLKLKPS